MALYLVVIFLSMAVISVADYFLAAPVMGFDIGYIIIAVIIATAAAIVVDVIFATVVRWILPKKWFSVDKKGFSAGKRECLFYERIGIKKWKDKVLELGAVTGFRKNKLKDAPDADYLERFIVEANYGIVVHLASMAVGFAVIFIFPLRYWLCFGFPVGVVNFVLNLMPLMILRYNLPKLHKVRNLSIKRASRASN